MLTFGVCRREACTPRVRRSPARKSTCVGSRATRDGTARPAWSAQSACRLGQGAVPEERRRRYRRMREPKTFETN